MKNLMTAKVIRNMVLSSVLILPLQIDMGNIPEMGLPSINGEHITIEDEVPPSATPKVVLLDIKEETCDINCFLNNNSQSIEFISKTFSIEKDVVYDKLIKANEGVLYDEFNIGQIKNKNGELKKYSSFEEGLIEYLFKLEKKEPKLFNKKRVAYNGGAKYVEDLIRYFTDIYDNVDYLTAISIGAAESGYYKVKYMLNCNNIYGGMSNSGLIKYRNIEYGVLTYIRLLSTSYYGKGLNTVESIGRVYCPTFTEDNKKIASPHWVKLVKTAKNKYKGTDTRVSVENLLND